MGKYKVGPYLKEMKDEIEILYPQDILAIIAEKKNAAAAGSNSSGVYSEAGNATPNPTLSPIQSLLGSVTPEPALQPASFTSDQVETSSAIGK